MQYLTKKSYKFYYYGLVAVILFAPLLYIFTSHEWMYSPIQMVDSYMDLTYSFFYGIPDYRPFYYKAARVPWISVIHYVQQFVGPSLLMPVMVCLSWVSLGFFYFLLIRRFFGAFRALYVLPWFVFFPHLIGSSAGGGLYNNFAAMSYFILSLFFWGSREDSTIKKDYCFAFLGGAFLASSIYTSIVYVNLLLIFPMMDYVVKRKTKPSHYFFAEAGAIFATIFWGFINASQGRPFFFFIYMLDSVWKLIFHPENQSIWWYPLMDVFTLGKHESCLLVFLTSIFLIAVIKLLMSIKKTGNFFTEIPTLHYIFIFIFWVLWHVSGSTTLTPPDFLYPLELPAALMVVSWMPDREIRGKDFLIVAVTSVMLWLFLYFSYVLNTAYLTRKGIDIYFFYFLCLLALYFIFCVQGEVKSKVGYFVLLGLVYSFTNMEPHIQKKENCTFREDSYNGLTEIVQSLLKIDLPGQFVIYSEKEALVDTGPRCIQIQKFNLAYMARGVGYIVGNFITDPEFTKEVDQLKEGDFSKLHSIKDPKLVLFPVKSPEFSSKVLAKAESFGYKTEKIYSSSVKILNFLVPYEVYSVKDLKRSDDDD